MILSNAKLATLKAAILANVGPEFVALRESGATGAMAEWYNAAANPVQKAWVSTQPADLTDDAPSYSTFDSIVPGKRDSWGFFLNFPRDFRKAKVRNWVVDVWGSGANAQAVLNAATRNALRGELVFGSTLRTTDTVSALDLTVEGVVTNENIVAAVNLP